MEKRIISDIEKEEPFPIRAQMMIIDYLEAEHCQLNPKKTKTTKN